ncbi:4-hydroxythreonine-4-phosphate dehydrogenase PdxA [Pedomonas mirosovicensis]|uniref:4-hydroxythreonine-4-phosphate dehydrogenase PdxA n=1 Tax=Pedomonas mirosovicensis TaxID=2908641 RepID=UPI0021671454|nr:4-hydroxythreonine-4-phosphate dehydrogenase PdxA [Pedomonas mirosovicensis]MCH8685309.1 4-hydroxythreonine-4-phosphate dehydrogenase PdxA [Pedomonas mirosovicensis]
MQPLAVSIGDPAGIGPEVIARSWEARDTAGLSPFVVAGAEAPLRAVWDGPIATISTLDQAAACFHAALPVLPVGELLDATPGQPTPAGAALAFAALEKAVALTLSGEAAAMVTAPVSKAELKAVGYTWPGQTEFVAERSGVAPDDAVMMLAGPHVRTVPVTIHIPLRQVPEALTTDLILRRAETTLRALRLDFGIAEPRLAVTGLNPHAGEDGHIGLEDQTIIAPAVEELRRRGWLAEGPLPADALFAPHIRTRYDAMLCMYHDQALIPVKALDFDQGVNMTLGLPIVRTSPDHGTAFNIAGRGVARPDAMIAALKMAAQCAARRAEAANR